MTSTVTLSATAARSAENFDWRPRAMTGMAYGAIIMGFFGSLWLFWALASMSMRTPLVIAAVLSFAASLWIPAADLFRKGSLASKQSAPLTPEQEREQSRMGKVFGFIFAAEGVLIFVAVNVLNNVGLGQYGISAIAAIVGLHFLPLARLFRRPLYYAAGTIMTAAALVSLAIPESIRIGVLAGAMAVVVWVTCVLVIRKGIALGRELHPES